MKGKILAIIFILLIPTMSFSSPQRAYLPAEDTVYAKAAVVINPDKSIVYEQNAHQRLLPASTTKLVTAMVALDHLDPGDRVKVSKNAAYTPTVPPRIKSNDEFSVEELLHFALMRSVNSAAVALAEGVAGSEAEFIKLMNQKVASIGTRDTRFANASGLPEKNQYTTAYDLAVIMSEAIKYPLIKEILGKKYYFTTSPIGKTITIENTDRLLWADDSMIGGKTGFTRRARHCFVGARETAEGTMITAVLGAPSRLHLWASTASLLNIPLDAKEIDGIMPVRKAYVVKHKIIRKHARSSLKNRNKTAKYLKTKSNSKTRLASAKSAKKLAVERLAKLKKKSAKAVKVKVITRNKARLVRS